MDEELDNIKHKRIQIPFDKGSIEIQFNYIIRNSKAEIFHLHVKADFECGIPEHISLVVKNKLVYFTTNEIEISGIKNRIISSNEYSKTVYESILEFFREELKNKIN